jgi:hypothetical protein
MTDTWARGGYRICEQTNSEGRSVLLAQQLQPLPDQIPLAIGDALHCQRSSLDHLIYALAKRHTPGMTSKQEKSAAFPIYDNAVSDRDERIQCLSDTARKIVVELAPDPAREPVHLNPLWMLNKMENRDKHREIHVAASAAAVREYILNASDGTDYFRAFGRVALELGADPVPFCEFARSPGVNAEITPTIEIVLNEETEFGDTPPLAALRQLSSHIRDTVFQRLEAHL